MACPPPFALRGACLLHPVLFAPALPFPGSWLGFTASPAASVWSRFGVFLAPEIVPCYAVWILPCILARILSYAASYSVWAHLTGRAPENTPAESKLKSDGHYQNGVQGHAAQFLKTH